MKIPTILLARKAPIIDVHAHTFFAHPEFMDIAKCNGVRFDMPGLRAECAANNVERVCCIYNDFSMLTPAGSQELAAQRAEFPAMIGVGMINPDRMKKDSLKSVEKAIADGTLKALKVYPGYYPYFCTDNVFSHYYKLAGTYDIPVYVHTGDTMGSGTRLKYARPLHADEIAVDFPDTNFILTQMGNPWLMDAAEVAYKNDNVYLDTAGLFSGMRFSKQYTQRLQYVTDYIDDHRKILYGSDWPMVRMADYISFIKTIMPRSLHNKVFYGNARRLFKL